MAPSDEDKFKENLEKILTNSRIDKGLSPIDPDIFNRIDKLNLKGIDFESIDLDNPLIKDSLILSLENNLDKGVDEIARALETKLKTISDAKKTVQPSSTLPTASVGKNFGPLNEMQTAVKKTITQMIKYSPEEKKDLLVKASDIVDQINIDSLNLILKSQGLEGKAVNREGFKETLKDSLESLKPGDELKPELIESALKSVNDKALSDIMNKGAFARIRTELLTSLKVLVGIAVHYIKQTVEKAKDGTKAAYQTIKKEVIESGKVIKSLSKDIGDQVSFEVKKGKNNFDILDKECDYLIKKISESKVLSDEGKVNETREVLGMKELTEMLQNKEQRAAIKGLIEDETIKNFSKDDMKKLMEKGTSTHQSDKKSFNDLMEKFQPKIMAVGNGKIDDVRQKVDKKVEAMKPHSKLESVNERLPEQEQKKSGPAMTS